MRACDYCKTPIEGKKHKRFCSQEHKSAYHKEAYEIGKRERLKREAKARLKELPAVKGEETPSEMKEILAQYARRILG